MEGGTMTTLTKVASAKDIAPGESIAVEVGGQGIAVFNVNVAFYTIDDTCTHQGGPLS